MGDTTKISWCDATFNPWQGCVKVSPACANCYAERDTKRFGKVRWGGDGTRVLTSEDYWKKPLKWNRDAKANGTRTRVFCASLADVFEDWTGSIQGSHGQRILTDGADIVETNGPEVDAWKFATIHDIRARLFRLIDKTPHLDWLLLTKRPENILRMWPCKNDTDGDGNCHVCVRASNAPCLYRSNVWIGASTENQEYADKRIPELLKCRDLSPVLFLSCEPLLGPIEFSNVTNRADAISQLGKPALDGINWVIVGGESGFNARPSNADWFRSIRDQCKAVGVPYHFKQFGEFDQYGVKVGKAAAGNMLDGKLHQEFPKGSQS